MHPITSAQNYFSDPEKKIMVVDDVDFNLDILTTILNQRNVQVVTAKSGEEAIDLLTRHTNIGLILMDIVMPGISGLETAKAIRKNPATACIPIIALTAGREGVDQQATEQAGMQGYLEKDFDPNILWQEIKRVTDSSHPCVTPCIAIPKQVDPDLPILQYDNLLDTYGDQEIVQQVVIAFFKDAKEQMETIQAAIDSCDKKTLSETCHSLKGSANLFTADQLAESAKKLYSFACENCCEKLDYQFMVTKNSYETLRKFVNDKLNLSI